MYYDIMKYKLPYDPGENSSNISGVAVQDGILEKQLQKIKTT